MRPKTGYSAGHLTETVTIQAPQRANDGAGGAQVTWSTVATVRAHVRPLSGRERSHAQREDATADYLVVIRNRSDVSEAHKIVWRSREMNIRFVPWSPRALFLEIECQEGVEV